MELGGCFDFDGDGIIDLSDFCFIIKGDGFVSGCLDWDGDGVLDFDDCCLDIVGYF